MTIKKDKPQKLYYSISEVAQMFDINESALRFWEKEFDMINPRKNEKGTRFYNNLFSFRKVLRRKSRTFARQLRINKHNSIWKLQEKS